MKYNLDLHPNVLRHLGPRASRQEFQRSQKAVSGAETVAKVVAARKYYCDVCHKARGSKWKLNHHYKPALQSSWFLLMGPLSPRGAAVQARSSSPLRPASTSLRQEREEQQPQDTRTANRATRPYRIA